MQLRRERVGFFVRWKLANNLTLSKSSERGTYNDRRKELSTSHSMKDELKIYPLDKFYAVEGFSEMFGRWINSMR